MSCSTEKMKHRNCALGRPQTHEGLNKPVALYGLQFWHLFIYLRGISTPVHETELKKEGY